MNIVCIDCLLTQALRELGHEVLDLRPEFGVLELPPVLKTYNFTPDLIIQQERLAPRLLLVGLEQLACPKIFWSVDTQLNLHWQVHYLALFDGILTPHISLLEALPPQIALPPRLRCPLPAPSLPYQPYQERKTPVSFVGRFTRHRPLRNAMSNILRENFECRIIEEISHADMLALYCDSKIIPNESLAYEVNARLLEGAAAGALVISQDVGEDQDSLLTPGEEAIIWHDGLELLHLTRYYLEHETEAAKIGQAAYARVQAEHLPRHRAKAVLDFAAGLNSGHSTLNATACEEPLEISAHDAAQRALWLSMVQLQRNGMLSFTSSQLLASLPANIVLDAQVNALRITLLTENGDDAEAARLSNELLQRNDRSAGADCLQLNSAASAAALVRGEFELARHFYWRYLKASGKGGEQRSAILRNLNLTPDSELELCLSWASLFEDAGINAWVGFKFEPLSKGHKGNLPECAQSWYFTATIYSKDWREWLPHAERFSRKRKNAIQLRQGFLAQMSLHAQKDWRLQLEYGLAALRFCRVQEGLHEISQARTLAVREGRESLFTGMLTRLTSKSRATNILLHCDRLPAST